MYWKILSLRCVENRSRTTLKRYITKCFTYFISSGFLICLWPRFFDYLYPRDATRKREKGSEKKKKEATDRFVYSVCYFSLAIISLDFLLLSFLFCSFGHFVAVVLSFDISFFFITLLIVELISVPLIRQSERTKKESNANVPKSTVKVVQSVWKEFFVVD